MSGATGAAGGNAAGRNGAGPNQAGAAGGQGGHDGGTAMMPTVAGGGTAAARRRQAGAQQGGAVPPVPAGAPTTATATPPGGTARPAVNDGYSKPTTYSKGQPTPAQGTRVPPTAAAAATAATAAAPVRPAAGNAAAAAQGRPAAPASGRTRRARLRVTRTDPWSVMKVSFLLSIALGVVTIVGVSLLWMVLDTAGVFSSVGSIVSDATGTDTNSGFDLTSFLSFGNVLMTTALIAVIDVVLFTALATLAAFIYNTAAGISGGVELTLSEEE